MTTLFTRGGTPRAANLTNDQGKPFYQYERHCQRCGGAGGAEQWRHTGWTCYECAGSGKGGIKAEPLYTGEQLAKLNAAQAKRDAKRKAKAEALAAEHRAEADRIRDAWIEANRDLYGWISALSEKSEFLGQMLEAVAQHGGLTERQVEAAAKVVAAIRADEERKVKAAYVGEVGQRVEITVTVERLIDITNPDSPYGRRYLYICRDENGNAILYRGNSWNMPTEGNTARIRATVEEHGEYKGLKQTRIGRPSAVKKAA